MTIAMRAFLRDRRGAIAIIFAASLLPLAMLVGLSIDFSFYTQARAQIALAADAAATHAIRAATETYTADVNANPPVDQTLAAQYAVAAGESAGANWFMAQLGALHPSSISNNTPVVIVCPNNASNSAQCPASQVTNPAGFNATVSYTGSYPPFFRALFSQNGATWTIKGTAGAQSTYSYVEILMLLDNSGSMDIGATPADITKIEQLSVCLPHKLNMTAINGMGAYDQSNPALDLDMTQVPHYDAKGSPTNISGKCTSNYTGPESPCGFACHTDANNNDMYGIARAAGVELRSDVVITAAENVISSMEANEQAPGQFSVGVYQFNSDISPLFPTQSNQSSGTNGEASSDLASALAAVEGIDHYNHNQNGLVPLLSNVASACCETDFPTSVTDLLSGYYSNGARFGNAVSAAGSGANAAAPQKDVFIVTDGMQDGPNGNRQNGVMTSAKAEQDTYSTNPAVCKKFKNLGFTVYVLYVNYNSLPNVYYMTSDVTPTPYFTEDFPSVNPGSVTTQDDAEATTAIDGNPLPANAVSPDEAALQACASSPSDFFEATSASDISMAMNEMLKSALSTTIRVTE